MYEKTIIVGRLTQDVELRQTNNGKLVANPTVAVNWGQEDNQVEFYNCVLWEQRAKFLSDYARKGSIVLMEGNMRTSKYQNQDGSERYKTELSVYQVKIIDGWANQDETQDVATMTPNDFEDDSNAPELDINSDDLPF